MGSLLYGDVSVMLFSLYGSVPYSMAYAKSRFSHDMPQMMLSFIKFV